MYDTNTRWGMRVGDQELSNGALDLVLNFFYNLKTALKKKKEVTSISLKKVLP